MRTSEPYWSHQEPAWFVCVSQPLKCPAQTNSIRNPRVHRKPGSKPVFQTQTGLLNAEVRGSEGSLVDTGEGALLPSVSEGSLKVVFEPALLSSCLTRSLILPWNLWLRLNHLLQQQVWGNKYSGRCEAGRHACTRTCVCVCVHVCENILKKWLMHISCMMPKPNLFFFFFLFAAEVERPSGLGLWEFFCAPFFPPLDVSGFLTGY